MKNKSVRFKITAYTMGCFVIGMIIILAVLFLNLRSAFDVDNREIFVEMGERYVNMIDNAFENPVSFLSGICSVAEAQIKTGTADREVLREYIFRAFDKYKISEGTAFMMEPNVYDGKDALYKDTDYGTPTSGRISYYYFRENGITNCLPQTEEDDQEFVQPYYLTSKSRKLPTYSDPYLYTFDGKTVSMITASYPMKDDAGNILGIATVDLYLDSLHKNLSDVKVFDTGYIVVVSESGSILYCPDLSLVGEDAEKAGLSYERPLSGESVRISEVSSFVNGKPSTVATVPLRLSLADSTFYISVVAPDDEANAENNKMLLMMLILFIIIGLAISFVVSITTGKIIKPLVVFTGFIGNAGTTGDISVTPEYKEITEKYAGVEDEIGQCINSTSKLVSHLQNMERALKTISEGDLTAELEILSDKDSVGISVKAMTDRLNKMFSEITLSTDQVSNGAKQIAGGAQSLAQGATQQAATIEELSDSVSDIAQKTKANAATAGKAAGLAGTIIENAEKGSRQMDEMISAVRDINEAGKSIERIIKTIDDIAFQTNILALNAAVEAARAGQHGKGFAVVAEEVRNLASKSAEAAKDTGNMIQNSIDKAELGSRIAGETAESLEEIVSGINESSRLIGEIASSSKEQSTGIDRINIGIDQVAQVVQQNSATAQESAAASEQMSGQSDLLQELISQFKLKNAGSRLKLPSASGFAGNKTPPPEEPPSSARNDAGSFGKY
ncbi:MAG: methyl-accepting chemotaxis protein [Oscillospiraceae bacterium]|nr:methyl-accepting chemotaxis protein [Oscillospiraceae bacterium]